MRKLPILFLLVLTLFINPSLAIDLDESTFEYAEQIYFESCLEPSLSCGDLLSSEWQKCRLYYFNTQDLTCDDPILSTENETLQLYISDYENNLRQFYNLQTTNPLQISRKIYASTLIGDTQEAQELLDALKENRIEAYKCWSETSVCDIEMTIDILKYLTKSGINRSDRIYQDALLWVESKQNKDEYEDWEFIFSSSSDTTCTLSRDTNVLNTITVNKTTETITRDYNPGNNITGSCKEDFCFIVKDEFSDELHKECKYANETSTFEIEPGCFNRGNKKICSSLLTGKALSIEHIKEENFELGKDWIEDNIKKAPIAAQRFLDRQETLANIYMYDATENEEIKTWVWYSQNNDGSFSRTNKDFTTLEAANVFRDYSSEEWMQDALNYIERTRPVRGYQEIEKETRFFEIFSPDRPKMTISPSILKSENEPISFTLTSTKDLNLTIDKPSEIDVELDIQENEATGQIILKSPVDKIYTGEITFTQGDYQKKVPYRIVKTPNLDMNFEENYYVIESRSVLSFPISKSDSELLCDFTFDRIFEAREDVTVTNQRDLVFRYDIEPGNYLVQAIYECESELGTLQGDYYFNIMHYPVLPFDIIKDFSIIDEEPGRVIIRNNIPEEITVDLKFQTPVNDYGIDSPITIPARQEAHTFIYQEVSSPLNIDEPNTLIGTSLGYEQRMDFEIRLDDNFHEQPATTFTDVQFIDTPILIIILIGMSAIIGVIVLYIVQNKKEQEKQEQERKSQSEEKKLVTKKEPEKNNKELGEVLVAVDKMMGEKDEEIESELKEQGYEIEEIKNMLKELEEVKSK